MFFFVCAATVGIMVFMWPRYDPQNRSNWTTPRGAPVSRDPSFDRALASWIADANKQIIVVDPRRWYINDYIAHLTAAPGWYSLSAASQRQFVHLTTIYWSNVTGKDDPSWFLDAVGGGRLAGYSVFKGEFMAH